MMVQHQRVPIGARVREVPDRMLGELLVLWMHAELLVVWDEHGLGRVPPGGHLIRVDPELLGTLRVALDGVGCCLQVLLRHEVGVDVIVGDGAVLVRAGNAVDAEANDEFLFLRLDVNVRRAHLACVFEHRLEELDHGRVLDAGALC